MADPKGTSIPTGQDLSRDPVPQDDIVQDPSLPDPVPHQEDEVVEGTVLDVMVVEEDGAQVTVATVAMMIEAGAEAVVEEDAAGVKRR
jgi:hypothetical protein